MIRYINRLDKENTCSMENYPTEAMDKINDWFFYEEVQIDFCWYDSNEMHIVITYEEKQYFLRLFTIGDKWQLSQDRVIG